MPQSLKASSVCEADSTSGLSCRMEAAEPCRLAYDVAIHRLQQLFACCISRQIQLRVQGVELEDIVMDRTRPGARAEIDRRLPIARGNTRTVPRTVWQVSRS